MLRGQMSPPRHVLYIYRLSQAGVRVDYMEEYHAPKLVGKRAPLNCLVLPNQHHRAWVAMQQYNMSFGEYVGALIDRAVGLPNKLDGIHQEALPIADTS